MTLGGCTPGTESHDRHRSTPGRSDAARANALLQQRLLFERERLCQEGVERLTAAWLTHPPHRGAQDDARYVRLRPGYARLRRSHTKPGKRARQGLGKSRCRFESAAQYERNTLNLLVDFQRIGKVVQPSKCMRTEIVGQIQPLPGRWTISGKVQSGSGLETSSDSWETSFRPRLSDFMGLLGNTQSKWSPRISREHRNVPVRARGTDLHAPATMTTAAG